MRCLWRGAVAGLLFTGTVAWADDPPKQDDPPAKQEAKQSPAKAYDVAKKAYDDAVAAMNKVVKELQDKKEQLSLQNKDLKAAFDARTKATTAYVKAAEEFVASEPGSEKAFDAIVNLANVTAPKPTIIKTLAEHHAMNPRIGTILSRLGRGGSKDVEALMSNVLEKNPNKDAKGNAAFSLASMWLRSKPKEAEKLFERVQKEFGDVKVFRDITLGQRAESNLYELRHLQVGMTVPEVEGEDMDGKKFKLSDYRGKVVMLDFWGHW